MSCKKKTSQFELNFQAAPAASSADVSDEPVRERPAALHGLPEGVTYLTVRQVMQVLSVCRTTVWRWEKDGILPEARRFTGRTRRWHIDEIRAFLARVAEGRQ
ncbi:DNA-binding protein [Loktanella sp. IMCC34160]|uniref:helix-turn-helix transcriptional regulator n=1 Tax=Loktanella sp. IMCC34160 TaxID=2510646 RepID=UPI00101D7EB9|nr:helix-turn-helix domain-containing protein [Loktanella sp. IMCC34160]RYG90991.1 DNA-binding protein [Loktanella sp. IMCC34160]